MHRYRNLVLAAGVLLGLGAAGVASAADMALKSRPVAPPVYNWTACYIGGNVGGGWSRMDGTQVSIDPAIPANAYFGLEDDTGFIGGAQGGCDFMVGSNLVVGIQGQFDFGSVKGQHVVPAFPTMTETNDLKSIATATGKFGYLFTPAFLGYGKLGMAWMNDRNQILAAGGVLSESASFWLPGIVVGAGAEWMFTPNWSVFAEYNYMWIEDRSGQHFNPAPGFVGEVLSVKQTVQTAMIGVNYKFHWDGPVVAKY